MNLRIIAAIVVCIAVAGCGDPLGKIQSKAEEKLDQTLELASKQGTRAFQFAGNVQMNRPGYRVNGIAKFGTFVEFDGVVYLEGVAGAASLSGQGDDETEASPYSTTPAPTPAAPVTP